MRKLLNIKVFVTVLLLIPLAVFLQQFMGLPGLKSLRGSFTKEVVPEWNIKNWLDGSFQDQFEKYGNQNFGYRSTAVRIHNQVKFSVFNESTNTEIYRTRRNYLVGTDYIEAYRGENYVGYKRIKEKCDLLKKASDYMEKRGKLLVVVIAPDKTSYFSEEFNLPPYSEIDSTNYKTWVRFLDKYEVPYIDFRKEFLQAKDTIKYPLFPISGIHWSVYGMRWAIDSVSGFVSQNLHRSTPRMKVESVEVSKNYQNIEYDIENALNLFFRFRRPLLGYQHFTMVKGDDALPKMLVISDSFFYEMYNSGLAAKFMDTPQFWYYNYKALKWKSPDMDENTNNYKLDSVISVTDVVWLMATDPSLDDFPWGFQYRFRDEVLLKGDSIIKK